MLFPILTGHPPPANEPPALIRTAIREDVQWSRPVFKAPPLTVQPPAFNALSVATDLRLIGLVGYPS